MHSIQVLAVSATLSLSLAAQTLTTFAVNPKANTVPSGLNDNGDVVGTYSCGQSYCGFLRSGSTGISKHLGVGVMAVAVNDADEFVGDYRISAFHWVASGKMVQFLRGTEPDPVAVNTAGYVAGSYSINNQQEEFIAFLMSPKGQISTIFAPPTGYANATGLNNLNQVVGWWNNGQGLIQGFFYSNGTVNSAFNYPNAVATTPTAINDSGEIVGTWTDSVGFVHGFYWTQPLGFSSFDAPKTTHTVPTAINNSGVIVGYFAIKKQTATSAFMLDTSGILTTLAIPHARSAWAAGINSQGTIMGGYIAGSESRGFLYQP